MKKQKTKINFIALLKYFYPATIVIIVIILGFLIQFLYHNVYQTIIQAELITDLRKRITEEVVEKEKFNTVLNNITTKREIKTIDIASIKDPFQEYNQEIE